MKNFDLDPESIRRLIASVKAEKSKNKKTQRESTDSDTTSVSDVMSVHSDSDLIDIDFGENHSDVSSNYEGYECNKNMCDYSYINQPTAAGNSQMSDHDKLIIQSYEPVSSVELMTDSNSRTNINTKLEYITDKTSNNQSISFVTEGSLKRNNDKNLKTDREYGIYKTDKNVGTPETLCENIGLQEPGISQTPESNDSHQENVYTSEKQKVLPDLDEDYNENDQKYNNTTKNT